MAGSENRWYDDWQLIIYLVQLASLGFHAIAIQKSGLNAYQICLFRFFSLTRSCGTTRTSHSLSSISRIPEDADSVTISLEYRKKTAWARVTSQIILVALSRSVEEPRVSLFPRTFVARPRPRRSLHSACASVCECVFFGRERLVLFLLQ